MNYDIAKKLKDADFPYSDISKQLMLQLGIDKIYEPTLEELIEACEDEMWILSRRPDGWCASGARKDKNTNIIHFSEIGSTPGEAVANLWLALHGKNNF